ncbi:MAG TPA: enoyl-CoA hydratase/isomerase family protein [Candidatus Wunengus sp. YC60]|uniref:enoyl-CoA hydratase/isomerase family protein n=1 Tax=Candidatus Wunengus sp. YC60 TaxID=3367697 RepID=UPI004025E312
MNTGNEHIKLEKKKEIGTITLNRSEARNALNRKMIQELGDVLTGLENDPQIRSIIITGNKDFCAGADIKEMNAIKPEEIEIFCRWGHKVINQIENMSKPVIAAINGFAMGGGCELALACDIRIAGESAKFGQPEVNLGLIPGFGGTQRLSRLVGVGKAKEMILTGRILNAKEAESIGLVNAVVKDVEVMTKAEEIVQSIAQKSPLAVKMAKALINENQEIGKGLEREIALFAQCFATQDRLEGINAFLEKRKPKFKGI